MPYLGLLDVAGIQEYVGRADRLVHIAEDSDQIKQLSDGKHALFHERYPDCERIFAAAGNAAYRGADRENLCATIRAISRQILKTCPGLQLQAAVVEYEHGKLSEKYGPALRELEIRKSTQPHSTLFAFTGERVQRERPEPEEESDGGIFQPRDFDNMICEGSDESHLMAVVSMDGLNMGGRLEKWLKSKFKDDEEFANRFETWSKAVRDHWDATWKRARTAMVDAFVRVDQLPANAPEKAREAKSGRVLLHPVMRNRWIGLNHASAERDQREKRTYFPCRRVYQGGDDMSFVCDARIALALTTRMMLEMEEEIDVEPPFDRLTVSAGILFVHYTFPFVRARELADEVRKEAKKRAMQICQAMKIGKEPEPAPPPSALDWWVNRQAAMERPQALWKVGSGESGSTCKPYLLHPLPDSYMAPWTPSWDWMEPTLLGKPDEKTGLWNVFADSRNKLKDLMAEAGYRDGWARAERLFRLRPLDDGSKPLEWLTRDLDERGVGFDRKPGFLLDAGELFDIHFPLPSQGDAK